MNEKPGAIILAGGQSRRMGRDKALLRLAPDGPRLIEMILAAVAPLVGPIVISTNRPDDYRWLKLPMVADNFPGAGPLAGLEAGLSATQAAYNLLMACDMPFVKASLLGYLLGLTDQKDAAIVPLNRQDRPEPLCAVYHRDCLPAIRQHLNAGEFKMSGWWEGLAVRLIPITEWEKYDPDLVSFRNLNTPEDLGMGRPLTPITPVQPDGTPR